MGVISFRAGWVGARKHSIGEIEYELFRKGAQNNLKHKTQNIKSFKY